MDFIAELIKVANAVDVAGLCDEASQLDAIIRKAKTENAGEEKTPVISGDELADISFELEEAGLQNQSDIIDAFLKEGEVETDSLVEISNEIDETGATAIADKLDDIIKKNTGQESVAISEVVVETDENLEKEGQIKIQPGKLKGWKKSLPAGRRRSILNGLVRSDGYATVIRRLNALRNISKDPGTDRAVNADIKYLQKKHRGR
jgi:hypothetical protein